MKMVSAAKLKKAQGIFNKFLPFTEKQQRILQNLSKGLGENEGASFFKETKELKSVLLVVVSSNRGLCGAFNSNVILSVQKRIAEYEKQGVSVSLYTVGKKVNQIVKKEHTVVAEDNEIQEKLSYEGAVKIANEVMAEFVAGTYDKIELVYNHAKSASTQVVTVEDYLPITLPEEEQTGEVDYIFEPNESEILDVLVPQMLRTQFYKVLLDSQVAEHAARMISMNKATDNAGDLLRDLNLEYNKARQASITNEILEIVSGAEALQQ